MADGIGQRSTVEIGRRGGGFELADHREEHLFFLHHVLLHFTGQGESHLLNLKRFGVIGAVGLGDFPRHGAEVGQFGLEIGVVGGLDVIHQLGESHCQRIHDRRGGRSCRAAGTRSAVRFMGGVRFHGLENGQDGGGIKAFVATGRGQGPLAAAAKIQADPFEYASSGRLPGDDLAERAVDGQGAIGGLGVEGGHGMLLKQVSGAIAAKSGKHTVFFY